MSCKRLHSISLAILLASLPIASHGQEDFIEVDLDQLLQEESIDSHVSPSSFDSFGIDLGSSLVTDRRSLMSRLADYSSITIIERDRLANARSLADLLEAVAGVDVRSLGGNGQLSTVTIRGASSGQVLVLLDGQPLSPMQSSDLSILPAGALQRIEVLRGPQAMQFGSGALGGVVNLVSVEPAQQESTELSYPESGLSFKEYFAELTRREFEQEITDEEPDGYYAALAGSNGLYGFSLGSADKDYNFGLSFLSSQNDYNYRRANGTSASRSNADASRSNLAYSWQEQERDWRLAFSDMSRGLPGSVEFPTLHARLDRQAVWLQTDTAASRTALSMQFSHVRDPMPTLNRGEINQSDSLFHLEHEVRKDNWLIRPALDHAQGIESGNETRAALDWSISREWDDGDWGHFANAGITAASDAGIQPLAAIGVRSEFGNAADAYLMLARAARHPSFDELYLSDGGSVRGNPDLDPEIVDNIEIGYRRSFSDARLELALFHSRYTDSIIFAPVSAYLVEARNTGRAAVAGGEASLDWQLAESLWWTTSATWLPVAEYSSGIPLTGRSGLHANSRLSYAVDNWDMGLTLDHSSSIPADLFGNLRTESRELTGIEIGRTTGDGRIQINISNLFNQAARDAWNYPLPGREFSVMWSSNL